MGTDVVKNVNKNNASHAVLFEALALVSPITLYFFSLKDKIDGCFHPCFWVLFVHYRCTKSLKNVKICQACAL